LSRPVHLHRGVLPMKHRVITGRGGKPINTAVSLDGRGKARPYRFYSNIDFHRRGRGLSRPDHLHRGVLPMKHRVITGRGGKPINTAVSLDGRGRAPPLRSRPDHLHRGVLPMKHRVITGRGGKAHKHRGIIRRAGASPAPTVPARPSAPRCFADETPRYHRTRGQAP